LRGALSPAAPVAETEKDPIMENEAVELTPSAAIPKTAFSNKSPNWALQPFKDFLDYSERLNVLLDLSIRGISMIRATPKMVEALASAYDAAPDPSAPERIAHAKEMATLAQREVDDGFPVLFAQATVSLWGALENMVRLFVVRWMENAPDALKAKAILGLKVKIGEYESLKGEDRFFYILDQLEREGSVPLRQGINRFEDLLEPFGLSGEVPREIRDGMFEMNHVRNLIMHRRSVADRRFVEACPFLGIAAGETVALGRKKYSKYLACVHHYALTLIARVGEHFGSDMSQFRNPPLGPKFFDAPPIVH
jgi:hypothetical protein